LTPDTWQEYHSSVNFTVKEGGMKRFLAILTVLATSCGGGQMVETDVTDGHYEVLDVVADIYLDDLGEELGPDFRSEDLAGESLTDVEEDLGLLCNPGDGCFLDPCENNSDCLSGWCVEHLGAQVCTVTCQDECPAGWNCKSVAGTEPDLVYVCASSFANLCKPCVAGADCKSIGGIDDVCVEYGADGDFCGGSCSDEQPCPLGFSCDEVTTVDGFLSAQCVNEAGVCPCTQQAIDLQLWTACETTSEWGTCEGKRVCGPLGLSLCDAPNPAAESCNGEDDDCDGDFDEGTCDDDNPCSEDSCHPTEGCNHKLLNGTECMDGNPCTAADHCVEGACVGTPVICNDDNPCTDDQCDGAGGCLFAPNTDSCDDDNPCTLADACKNSTCQGVDVACDCQSDSDCVNLEDGDLCNGTLYCDTAKVPYQCAIAPATVIVCPEPTGNDAPCLTNVCDNLTGECDLVSANAGQPCDDGNPCSAGDKCTQGKCAGNAEINCNDGNPCTDDFCDPTAGCLHTNNVQSCQDGDACTIGDVCEDGACTPGPAKSCDDSNPCTDDICDPVNGCVQTANDLACDDNNECTTEDHCANGICAGTGSLECDDANPCTKDICLTAGGCDHVDLDGAPCQDGDACTIGDLCQQGQCESGSKMDCGDGNPCTDDMCDDGACTHAANDIECDDGNACTSTSFCQDGICTAEALEICDDGNLCTTDFCHPVTGCSAKMNESPCDDANPCTESDFCKLGECAGTVDAVCNDNNICTDDSCSPDVGCVFLPNTVECNDKNACTLGDICADTTCLGTTPVDCNDGITCTADACFPTQGCVYEIIIPCCGNGFVEPPEECDDGNNVNDEQCLAVCKLPGCDDGILNGDETAVDCGSDCPECEDGLACKVDGDCQSGVCDEETCQEPTCEDEVQNSTESDVDCGGACNACGDGQGCNGPGDCTSFYCYQNKCQTPACDDQILNGTETDTDCGGDCPPCLDGQGCLGPADCANLVCTNDVCQEPTCLDEVQNGTESDADCGGTCDLCEDGKSCNGPLDCISLFCHQGECKTPTCDDQIQNSTETDIDCGGDCPACLDGQACLGPADCVNLVCTNDVCQEPTCEDEVQNGTETDVDCGDICAPCGAGLACLVDDDCIADALCQDDVCSIYGLGQDGSIEPGSGTVTINTTVSPASGTAGETTLTVNEAVQFGTGFRVLVHQTTGPDAGWWEERLVVSQDGTALNLSSALTNSYVTEGVSKAQVLVVPEYETVTLTGQTLTAPAWNGSVGGILAFTASSAVTLEGGVITMAARGFRGKQHGCTYRCQDGWSGESIAGDMGTGSAPAANNMGGGGGQRGQDCAAGGGGGHGTAGANGTNGSKGNCHVGNHEGGKGGAEGGVADTRERILFGGGGGEGGGDEDGGYPGKGGAGGGLVIVKAPQMTLTGGSVALTGETGLHGHQGCGSGGGMGGGGGGAGGGAWLRADSISLGTGLVTASGAGGGKCGPGNSSHPGGTGGVGRIAVRAEQIEGTTTPSWVESVQ
jgi:hypothetical protein